MPEKKSARWPLPKRRMRAGPTSGISVANIRWISTEMVSVIAKLTRYQRHQRPASGQVPAQESLWLARPITAEDQRQAGGKEQRPQPLHPGGAGAVQVAADPAAPGTAQRAGPGGRRVVVGFMRRSVGSGADVRPAGCDAWPARGANRRTAGDGRHPAAAGDDGAGLLESAASSPASEPSNADRSHRLQGLRHPRRRRPQHRRDLCRAPRPRLRQRGAGCRREGRGGGPRRAPVGPRAGGGAGPRPGVHRPRRGRHRPGDDADAVLRGRHARPARLHQRHPGHRQPQPQGLQRLQDGDGRPRHLRRRHPEAAPAHRGRGLHRRAAAARARMDIGAEYAAPHRRRLPAGAADAHRGRLRQRHPRRQRAGHPARAGLRGHRAVQPRRRRLSQPPPRPEQAREPGRPDQGRARRRGRTRPGLRRRRRPPRRRHARRQHHLPRPPDHALRARHPAAPQGRAHHLRRQVLAAPAGGDPRGRRRAGAVEDRALADQGQAAGRPARPSPAR